MKPPLPTQVSISVAVDYPKSIPFIVTFSEREVVIAFVHDYYRQPIGRLLIPPMRLVPGTVVPLQNHLTFKLRLDDFWAQWATAQFFTKPAKLAFGHTRVHMNAKSTSTWMDWVLDTSDLDASYVYACNGSADFQGFQQGIAGAPFDFGNCTSGSEIRMNGELLEYFLKSFGWMGGCLLLLAGLVFEYDLRAYARRFQDSPEPAPRIATSPTAKDRLGVV